MHYVPDLRPIHFWRGDYPAYTPLGVGWLAPGRPFTTEPPSDALLDLLWDYSEIRVPGPRLRDLLSLPDA